MTPVPEDVGLICGYHFSPVDPADDESNGSVGTPIEADAAAAWLAAADALDEDSPSPGLLWLHFNLAHNSSVRWLEAHAGLPDAFFESLRGGLNSTRLERVDDVLLAVVNDLQFDFAFEASDTATLLICLDRRLIVTGRRKPLRSIDQLRRAVRSGEPSRSSADLLAQLLRHQADMLVDLVRQITTRVDDIEDRFLAGRLDHKRARLGAMRRLLVRLQRLLLPEPAALFRLLQHPPTWMDERDTQDLRDATEEFSVVLHDMAALQERVKLLQEEVAARINEETSRSLFVLTIVTVLALPINIIAGLLGMNVGGIPLAENGHGFWIVVSLILGLTAVAALITLIRRHGDDS
ncbi:transporter [Leptothrix discophora]|uniref:Transporter n=1 Tax=Leptothrix discophora TaxID=89 RepID=A0ABT9G6G6_LEPDI|nr:transporter [Leptothrix discophora]MDP4302079.1 transporter [Leptothrix discophora]